MALQYMHEKSSFFDLVDDPLLCGWRHQLAYGAKVGKERGDGGTRLGERFIHDYLNVFLMQVYYSLLRTVSGSLCP